MSKTVEIPVPVLDFPHWRVNFRPFPYNNKLIPSLGECLQIIEKTKLMLRGWDYPHLSPNETQRGQGNNWIASWSNFRGHIEYWRFYQSGQFLHLFCVKEVTKPGWKEELEKDMRGHLSFRTDVNWDSIPGYFDIVNFIYTVSEIYEFAARLCQAQIYTEKIQINIELRGIKGFVLAAGWSRSWHNYYHSSENILAQSNEFKADQIIASSKEYAIDTIIQFFERFGWFSPPESLLREEQDKFLKGNF